MWFYEWWGGLSFKMRGSVAILFLMFAGLLWWAEHWLFWWALALGVVLLLFSFPTAGEKKGYHDF